MQEASRTQILLWHRPPGQQSASVVQTPLPSVTQVIDQRKPVAELPSGRLIPLQHSSPKAHSLPPPKHWPAGLP